MNVPLGTLTYGTATLSDADRRRHLYVSGKTGTGKSTFLLSMMLHDIEHKRPFALIDPHGDLSKTIADACPHTAIYLDPLDPLNVVGFNPLSTVPIPERSKTAAHIVSSFKHLYGDSWGPRLEYIFTNCIRLLLDTPLATLLSIPLMLTDSSYRDTLIRRSTDPFVTSFWLDEFDKYTDRFRSEAIAPLQNKVGALANNSDLRAIIGQQSTIKIPKIMNEGQYLICNLSKRMGADPSHLLGALLTTAFAQAAEARATVPEEDRRDFTLYVDEFQNFATDSFASILSEARKYRLNLVMANQFLTQLPDHLRAAVMGNVGTIVAFRVGAEDAELLAKEMGHPNPQALTETPNHHAWIKNGSLGYLSTERPDPPTGNLARIIDHTHRRHARSRQLVEKRIHSLISGRG